MPTKSYIPVPRSTERPHSTGAIQVIASGLNWISRVWELRRQRKALALLDGRLLKDVGMTHDDVRQELDKPFWK